MSKPRFRPGNQVRVLPGETAAEALEPDYAGWVGTVESVERDEECYDYFVAWSPEALSAVDAVYREIWARNNAEDSGLWFRENQLEPHAGEIPPPPSAAEEFVRAFRARDARIAEALAVAGPEEFPFPDDESLAQYHAYLSERLEFPFEAQFDTPPDPLPPERPGDFYRTSDGEWYAVDVTAIGLVPWEEHPEGWAEGLLCRALEENRPRSVLLESLEVKQEGPSRQLVEDFKYWYDTWNDSDSAPDSYDDEDDEDGFYETGGDGIAEFDQEDDEEDEPGEEPFAVEDYLNRGAVVSHEAATPPPRHAPIVRDGPRVGRNDECPCGSGQKFKKCCMRRAAP